MPGIGVLHAVLQDVRQRLRAPRRIAHEERPGLGVDLKRNVGQIEGDRQRFRRTADDLGGIDLDARQLDHAGVDAGHLEQRRHQPANPLLEALHHAQAVDELAHVGGVQTLARFDQPLAYELGDD